MSNYQELIFYQKARQVVKGVDALMKSWPKTMQAQEISRQLFRSATSVGANIAEGHGRHQGTEYIHYLIIAQASANETEHWLHTAQDCDAWKLVKKLTKSYSLNNEVVRMITSSISTIRSKQGSKSVQENHADYSADGNAIIK